MTIKFLKKPVQCRNRKCGYTFLPKDRDSLPRECPKCSRVMWYILEESKNTKELFKDRVRDYLDSRGWMDKKDLKDEFPDAIKLDKHVDAVLEEDGFGSDLPQYSM